jgi:hypothetical protein
MKTNFLFRFFYWLFTPIRYIITYKRKTCFWGHDWGKWTKAQRTMLRQYRTGEKYEYTEYLQYRYCKRCNKYEQEMIK